MDQRLKEAASSGDIDSLYSIIQEDAYILDRIDRVPFVDTPLHISASTGHVYFSLEIMRLKPSFARRLNSEGYSPIHLALQNNQTETVFRLVNVDRELISIQGREGLTPLHVAAASGGKDDILAKFLVLYPKSIKELTVHKESALHVAVKNGNIKSMRILLEWIRQACMTSVLNWSDDEGNNIMHLAALGNQTEMVKLLLGYKVDIDMKSKNLEGMTAVDLMKEGGFLEDEEVREMLDRAHTGKKQPRLKNFLWSPLSFVKRFTISDDYREFLCKEGRNVILVVSVLIATATYRAALTPPDDDVGLSLKSGCFRYVNTFAFVASMIGICLHLPSSIRYALQLVLPLVICYALLILVWWW